MSRSEMMAHPVAFPPNWWARAGWILLAAYVVYACSLLDFTWARFMVGIDNGARFVGRMFPPNFSRWEILLKGLTESIEIAVLASALGIQIGRASCRERVCSVV
jgi:phosphonate transport system permease protein